jgi:hypothetical protein
MKTTCHQYNFGYDADVPQTPSLVVGSINTGSNSSQGRSGEKEESNPDSYSKKEEAISDSYPHQE